MSLMFQTIPKEGHAQLGSWFLCATRIICFPSQKQMTERKCWLWRRGVSRGPDGDYWKQFNLVWSYREWKLPLILVVQVNVWSVILRLAPPEGKDFRANCLWRVPVACWYEAALWYSCRPALCHKPWLTQCHLDLRSKADSPPLPSLLPASL